MAGSMRKSKRHYRLKEKQYYSMMGAFEMANNIFDYNYIAHQRNIRVKGPFAGDSLYSLGYSLRRYSGYQGLLYCASEHGLPAGSLKDTTEYKDNDRKVVLVMSKDRREFLQKHTDKLLIPIGPSMLPYCENIYSDFVMEAIKHNLGKTLLVFPQHSCGDSECMPAEENLMEYVNRYVSKHGIDTVLVCLYYEDIYRGEHIRYQKAGWVPVTAGHKYNLDFGYCLKTIINLSDCVLTQGYGSSAIYSIFLNKPVHYISGNRGRIIANKGSFEDKNPWMEPYEEALQRLADSENEVDSKLQWDWANKIYGFNEVKSPEQMRQLLQLTKELEHYKTVNSKMLHKVIQKETFSQIRESVEEAMPN